MEQLICPLSLIPLRKEPSHRTEQVSQLLFGEKAILQEEIPGWYRVVTLFDSYPGWVEKNALMAYDEKDMADGQFIIPLPLAEAISNGRIIYLPAGSEIPLPDKRGYFSLGNRKFQLTEQLSPLNHSCDTLAKAFLHSPYLWGGRTFFGIDCSGLTQIVYKIAGIALPRDAWQQATTGDLVSAPGEAERGDLAFFKNAEGKIVHVGIITEGYQIIHASRSVRIDTLDPSGIFSRELNTITHSFHSVRRIRQER